MAAITITDLTTGELAGTGIFDKLMQATKAHIHEEYSKGRIRGPEYATVYLGALQTTMDRALQFILSEQKADLEAQLLQEQIKNALTENTVLVAQECKLRAEFDLLTEQRLKTVAETALLAQKKVTEQAQVSGTAVDADSVIGKQKTLYAAQTEGYKRDSEQKAAKLMADIWSVQRTTDEGIIPNADNMLQDTEIGRAISKLLDGVGA